MFRKNRGTVLTENVIFIVLNLAFFAIMILFLFKQGGNANFLEQAYAKQIALFIDSAKPGMEILVDIGRGADSNKEWFSKNFQNSVSIQKNIVSVKFTDKGGYSYSFFNDVEPSFEVFPDGRVYIIIR